MEILMRDHLIKLFKVIYYRIGRDCIINTKICDQVRVFKTSLLLVTHLMNM